MRALLAVQDLAIARDLSALLPNIVLDQCARGEEAVDLARGYDYDIILLDMRLSDMDGYEALRWMRASGIESPLIMLSPSLRPLDKAKALVLGADDVLTAPCDRNELLARIQAVTRRSRPLSASVLQAGPLAIYPERQQASVNGKPINLTPKEYATLELLILRKRTAISKQAFLNHLYRGIDEPDGKIIDVFICKLRKKLAEAGADGMIGTIFGAGYVLREPAREFVHCAEPSAEDGQQLQIIPC